MINFSRCSDIYNRSYVEVKRDVTCLGREFYFYECYFIVILEVRFFEFFMV